MKLSFWLDMLRDWGIALGIALVIFVAWTLFTSRSPISGDAPDIEVSDLDGGTVRLSQEHGKTVVLNFWATWCGPCLMEIPELVRFQEAHSDVELWGISIDRQRNADYLRKFAEKKRINYPVLHDPRHVAADQFGVSSYPTTFVVDGDGHIQAAHAGTLTKKGLEKLVYEQAHEH